MPTSINACREATATVTPALYGVPIPGRLRAVRVALGAPAQVVLPLFPGDCAIQDLVACGAVAVNLLLTEATRQTSCANAGVIAIPGAWVDPAAGLVEAVIDPLQLAQAGIYDAQFVVTDAAGGVLHASPFVLLVEPNLTLGAAVAGPPSLLEIRLQLRDSGAGENLLFDDLAFSDVELIVALRRAVDLWNDALPPIDVKHTTMDFPYRYWWIEGALATLFGIAAEFYRRNHLDYTAGGVQVADLNKSAEYQAMANQKLAEYKAWVQQIKIALNRDMGYGHLASAYTTIATANGY